ncbi:MAG: hypothetical protein HC842_03815 [Cytophagales bacterium]|nr:hypothetical protein [Cytophagales bacterium]
MGQSTLLGDYQQAAPPVQIQVAGRQSDVVFPALNPSFAKFALSAEEMATTVHDFPPVVVPYGRLSTATYAEVLLFQRVGNITTDRPLWALGEGPQRKQGVVLGDGIWQWRLDEYRQRESFEVFDQLLTKTIQYLAAKPDKRKFRVKPTQPEFDTRQAVIFETVMYNDLFEPVYGPAVELELRSDEGQRTQYAYSTSPSSTLYQVSGLSAGVYTYRARTTLDGKVLEDQGQLVVKDQNQEMDRLEANHELLRAVAQASGGQFAPGANWDQLEQWLTAQPTPLLAHSHEALDPLLNLWIVMAILLLWMSVEWFLRKFYGGY